ncbi:SsrA-binding protein [Candidatus Ecksteinia adelgidicola]|nr:SsrA-binding protein [Candidatus Ecksteinia adelgidicola]
MIKIKKYNSTIIVKNKRAKFDYFIENEIVAGLVLHGWEVKSLRSNNVNINNSYVILRDNEAYLFGAVFLPLTISSSHLTYDAKRIRKLLLHKNELNSLYKSVNQKRYTIIAISMHWKNSWGKVKIGIAKGKKNYDKRNIIKDNEWRRKQSQIIKHINY